MNIDRDSPIPAYYQIALDLRHRIHSGEWISGSRLPPETDLADAYEVSRMTMRQAIAELVKDGFLSRQRGIGTFVTLTSREVVPRLSFPISFALRIKELGFSPSNHVLKSQVFQNPSREIVEKLKLMPDESVAYFKRVLLANEQAMALNRSFLPGHLCPGVTNESLIDSSISTTLEERFHLSPVRADHWLEAVIASEDESDLLDTEPGTPLLLLTTLSYLKSGEPLEYSLTHWVGERMRLYVSVAAEQPVSSGEVQIKP
jgi:GntR family transcriptional regulator